MLAGSEEKHLSELQILVSCLATGKEAEASGNFDREGTSHDVTLAPLPFLATYARLGDYRLVFAAGPLEESRQPVL